MAKQQLPTNFKDDVLTSQMAGRRKYNLIQNEDGTISLEDVTEYSQVGSSFGASQMNATNVAANESADKSKIIDTLGVLMSNTQFGYMAGALALKELSEKIKADDSNKVMRIGKMRIKFGSWVTSGIGKDYVKLNDAAGLKQILELEENFNQNKFACFVMNGEGAANGLTCTGAQWWLNDGLYCYLSGNLASGNKIRINFIYLYFDDYTPISG